MNSEDGAEQVRPTSIGRYDIHRICELSRKRDGTFGADSYYLIMLKRSDKKFALLELDHDFMWINTIDPSLIDSRCFSLVLVASATTKGVDKIAKWYCATTAYKKWREQVQRYGIGEDDGD